ncbi:MAG: O-antigen ligase family protein, partial [bacterium]|nr:O-antigen ligase family protein [bacterium]
QRSLTGVGYGTYPYASLEWKAYHNHDSKPFDVPLHAHNIFLHILAEQGIPGMLFFLFIMFSAFRISAGIIARNGKERLWGICAAAVLIGFTVHELFNYYINYPSLALPFWAFLGGISSADRREIVFERAGRSASLLLLPVVLLLLLLSVRIGAGRLLYTSGRQLYEQGKYRLAIEILDKAIIWDKEMPLYHVYKGKALYRLYIQDGDRRYLKKAIASYELAVSEGPPESRYVLDLAALYSVTGDNDKVLELRKIAGKLSPRSRDAAVLPREYDCRPGYIDVAGNIRRYSKDNMSVWDGMVIKRVTHWGLLAPLQSIRGEQENNRHLSK